jgi:hypothetical protein
MPSIEIRVMSEDESIVQVVTRYLLQTLPGHTWASQPKQNYNKKGYRQYIALNINIEDLGFEADDDEE